MKRLYALVYLLAMSTAWGPSAFGQTAVDLGDRLYTDLDLWAGRGVIDRLPPLRPYPIQLIRKVLAEVEARGTADDRRVAGRYEAEMKGGANGTIGLAVTFQGAETPSGGSAVALAGPIATLQGSLSPLVSYSTELAGLAMNGSPNSLLPFYQRTPLDIISTGGAASVGTNSVSLQLSMESQAAVGTASTYFEAGVMRESFGPFDGDSIVLSSTAPQAGALSFTWQQGLFTYTQLLMDVSATLNNGSDGANGPFPDKFLAFQSLEFYPTKRLSLGIYDSLVWGPDLNPLYLLPLPTALYYAEGTQNFPGAAHIGLSAGVDLPQDLDANGLLYVGDASFNDLIRLNFNTMLLFAAEAGLSWTPSLPLLKRVQLIYMMVTPYDYTHQNDSGDSPTASTPNYENYTNDGENIATSLDPNSDRIEVDALLRPLPSADVTLFGRFIQHGNASDAVPGVNNPTGTVFDDGYSGTSPTFAPGGAIPPSGLLFRFLAQAVIEEIAQAGFDAKLYLDTPFGRVDGDIAYTFEYVANPVNGASGEPQSGLSEINNYLSVEADYRY